MTRAQAYRRNFVARPVVAAASHSASVNSRLAAGAATTILLMLSLAAVASAQGGAGGGAITPYAGYLISGSWYDGPVGTSLGATNTPVIGAQLAIPIADRLSLVGNVGYGSSDIRVGVPVIGGLNVGTSRTWVYDAGLEFGGLSGSGSGIAPFVQAGIGGMTHDMRNRFVSLKATNLVYTGGVGIDVGMSRNVALRLQARDYIGRFDTSEAIGLAADASLSHNWALSAGIRLAF